MEISLPPELQQFISDQVSQGIFPTANDAVCQAVEALRLRQRREAELRFELNLGLEDCRRREVGPVDRNEIIANGRQLLAQRQAAKGT